MQKRCSDASSDVARGCAQRSNDIHSEIRVGRPWLEEFAEFLGAERAEKTVDAYLQDLKHFCAWFERANGEVFEPGLLNTRDLKDFHTWCVEVERCAAATWNRRRASLLVLGRWCVEALGMRPIAAKKALPSEDQQTLAPRWLTQPEERRVMRQVELNVRSARTGLQRERAIRDAALVSLMRYAGLRVDEVAQLHLVNVQIGERSGWVEVYRGKRGKTRWVALSSSAREAVTEWLAVRGENCGLLMFGKLSTRAIEKRVALLAEQTRVADLDCHALRHTFAKFMVDAGRPLTEVQLLLGHEKLDTTKRYVLPGQEDLAEAVEVGELGKLRKKS